MSKLMLIDAAHPEETRVAVVADRQIEDFDFEARDKRQLRGNIYLAKVTRVEPSLQAAFVEYGGNRHGFLAFSEIHPDYYQIPQEDREALLAEEAASVVRDDDDDDDDDSVSETEVAASEDGLDTETVAEDVENTSETSDSDDEDEADAETNDDASEETTEASEDDTTGGEDDPDAPDDAVAERPRRRSRPSKRYKIQEVIKRRQVLLIQVVKEERGNKGAALTTYLSLAGRYGVLMPNTARGGGISRKITNAADRKRLKKIMQEFEVPHGMGLIIRTAGAKRTKTEISRDYDYLIRLWSKIRERTLESVAPTLIHEEGNLVLRAIRDLYDRDVENIHVEGEKAYEEAKSFISMLMPEHAKKVGQHEDKTPLFITHGVESQLDNIFTPTVTLPSGGYLVINQTEALVAIDVNSGKATRERNIEATALKTNLEAAAEACRQMRLRDLAGLIVIDFIDMEENKNNRAVERKMKECLTSDRARVQTGRISQFGLFEISRQRRRAGVLELSSEPCKVCSGTGRIRSTESAALQLLRAIEERAADQRVDQISVKAPSEVALYILNHKRDSVSQTEDSADTSIHIEADNNLMPGEYEVEATSEGVVVPYKPIAPPEPPKRRRKRRSEEEADTEDTLVVIDDEDSEASDDDDDQGSGRRRRRGRRGGRRRKSSDEAVEGMEVIDAEADGEETSDTSEKPKRSRRRRVRKRTPDVAIDGGEMLDAIAAAPFLSPPATEEDGSDEEIDVDAAANDETAAPDKDEPRKRRRGRRSRRKSAETEEAMADNQTPEAVSEKIESAETPEPEAIDASDTDETTPTDSEPVEVVVEVVEAVNEEPAADTSEIDNQAAPTADDQAEEEPKSLHALHATVEEESKKPKKKKAGWWSRSKSDA